MRLYTDALVGELTQGTTSAQAAAYGFPVIGDTEIPPCGNNPVCNRTRKFTLLALSSSNVRLISSINPRVEFFEGLKKLPPSFSPHVTPAYSNIGFTLLGYALEQMTGRSFGDMVRDRVLEPLNLTRTFYSAPEDSLGIIPGNRYSTNWAFD